MIDIFVISWTIITVLALSVGTYFDLHYRLIPDKVWLIQLIVSFVVTIIWLLSEITLTTMLIAFANIIFSIVIAVVAFITGSFGGADSKALIVMGISSPIVFSITQILWQINDLIPPVFYILLNFLIFMIIYALYNVYRNIMSIAKFGPLFEKTNGNLGEKISILVSGMRKSIKSMEDLQHLEPAEILVNGEWKLDTPIFQQPLDDEEYEKYEEASKSQALQSIEEMDRIYLWVRPQPPGILLLLVSYLFYILIGSPLGFLFNLFT